MENSFAQISELFAQFSENAKLRLKKAIRQQECVPVKRHLNLKSF